MPTNPQTNERRLGLDLETVTESISENRIDACSTSASGAPLSNTRLSVKTTSEPPLPCVDDVKRAVSPGKSSETLETAGVSRSTPGSDLDAASCARPALVTGLPASARETPASSDTTAPVATSCLVSRRSTSTVGISEQVQNLAGSSRMSGATSISIDSSFISRADNPVELPSGATPTRCVG